MHTHMHMHRQFHFPHKPEATRVLAKKEAMKMEKAIWQLPNTK